VAEDYHSALVAGVLPDWIELPGGLIGRQRIVRFAEERLQHVAQRRPESLLFCLLHTPLVLASPQYLGYRPDVDRRRVEFVRQVSVSRLLLVAVKFLDDEGEAWVSTTHPLDMVHLTRRLRAGTMQIVCGS